MSIATPNLLLVIDDEPAWLELVEEAGRELGYEVISASTANQARNAINAYVPSLIVLDLNLPGLDGVEIMRDLSNLGRQAPIIIVSGADARVLDTASRLGAARGLNVLAAVQKPLRLETLRDLIRRNRRASAVRHEDLARAIANDQISLMYEPKIALATRRLVGVEALARWMHPELGPIPPIEFVALAEKHRLIGPLTRSVFRHAARTAAWLHGQNREITVSVNCSPHDVEQISLPDDFMRICAEEGAQPHMLTLEITETTAMQDHVSLLDVATRLRLKGFLLAIDDFGIGHSSLLQLRRLPFSELKIDQIFVQALRKDPDSDAIIRAIIALSHELGLKTTAEGVASVPDIALLARIGCDYGQGVAIGRPEDIKTVLERF